MVKFKDKTLKFIICTAIALSIPSRAFALPITIEVHPTQVTSLNYQIYYNGNKYMKDLEFYITNVKSRSSMVVKSSNSYLYVKSIAFGDYKIEVEAGDFERVYTVTLDEEYDKSSHKTKKLDLDQPSGQLEIEFVPESDQFIPPSGEDGDNDSDTSNGEDGTSGGQSNNGNSTDDLDNNSLLDEDSSINVEPDGSESKPSISLPITGSPFRMEFIASFVACIFMWKGVSLCVKKNKTPTDS